MDCTSMQLDSTTNQGDPINLPEAEVAEKEKVNGSASPACNLTILE